MLLFEPVTRLILIAYKSILALKFLIAHSIPKVFTVICESFNSDYDSSSN